MTSSATNRLVVALLILSVVPYSASTTRKYYVAIQEVDWDYTKGDMNNLLDRRDQKSPDKFLRNGPDRVGSVYKKAVYREYTDDTFKQQKLAPPSQGIVGPMIRGEVGDILDVVYFNNASREFSMHPHGVKYLKEHESAIYVDGTSGRLKADDIVFPGQRVRLLWNVTDADAPGPNDPNCLPWAYHSHIQTGPDTSAGLIGILVTCRAGTLDDNNKRKDVDLDFPLLVKIWDENMSWFMGENTKKCGNPGECRKLMEEEDEDFIESNYMAAINGYMYGHLTGLKACVGQRIAFYVIGMGNEFDIHTLHFHGQNLHYKHTRGDTISVYSATFVAAEMTPQTPGYWLITDMVGSNKKNGMGAYLDVQDCTANQIGQTTGSGLVRNYFLSADRITWNFAPSGLDRRTNASLLTPGSDSFKYYEETPSRAGGEGFKAKFVGYEDATFARQMVQEDEHLGILGPVLRGEAGDTLKVTLRNNIRVNISLVPHVISYNVNEEAEGGGGSLIPGQVHTYTFHVPDDLFDNSSTPCMNFIYSSGYDPQRDRNTGLVGILLLCRKGYNTNPGPKPKEKFLMFQTFNENEAEYLRDNYPNATDADYSDPDFIDANYMFSINGYSFGNLPGLTFCLGDDVMWYVSALGETFDVHTASFDGHTFTEEGRHRDTRALVPGQAAALRMVMDNPGRWAVESHSNLARTNGMFAFYRVDTCGHLVNSTHGGQTREFFVAAEETDWDYAPVERSVITGRDLNDPRSHTNIFIRDDEDFIGGVYKKAVYRDYTDAGFLVRRLPEHRDQHKDMLGPVIRAEVGDVIKVHFKNKATRPYSMHPHGVRYSESDSGANYHASQAVSPGQVKVYTWEVPDRAGPGPSDPNCVPWVYFSGVDPMKDPYSGLLGVLLVCRAGTLDFTGRRRDVDHEFLLLMHVMNENLSWYLKDNIAKHAPHRQGTDYMSDGDFEESNIMHAINGRLSGNTHHLMMEVNNTVTWYFVSLGTEVDLHSFHMHGHTILESGRGHRDDAVNLFPGEAEAVTMVTDNPGTWLLHCHQLDHIVAGMETVYTVTESGSPRVDEGSDSSRCLPGDVRDYDHYLKSPATTEDFPLIGFEAICRNYDSYVSCVTSRQTTSLSPTDRVLQMVSRRPALEVAFSGLCVDLEELRKHSRCLLSTPEIRHCYDVYQQSISYALQKRSRAVDLACSASVARWRCQSAIYRQCDLRTGEITQNFFFAGLSQHCRDVTGIKEEDEDVSGGADVWSMSKLVVLAAMFLATLTSGL